MSDREQEYVKRLVDRVRLFDRPTLKERIAMARKHMIDHQQQRDTLWPYQEFAMTLDELLSAAERGA